jgi:hypothetical protein
MHTPVATTRTNLTGLPRRRRATSLSIERAGAEGC